MHTSYPFLLISSMLLVAICADEPNFRLTKNWLNQCTEKEDVLKCLKIQALKVIERAIRIKTFTVTDGINIVANGRHAKSMGGLNLNESKLENLDSNELYGLLGDSTTRFLDTHRVEVNLPKLVAEEGRGKKGGNKGGGGYGAMMAALAIKGTFLAMAYKGIAVMAGTALIVGKMALLLSAILGLKKLVSDGGEEKTTFEIIKQPKYTEEHSHSTSYDDDHDHYRRQYKESGDSMQKRVYRFKLPVQK
ncbi:uncharacterized protein LOC132703472 [Cylas formicarius]|uniref:uncharacterized protein LOC132703472 n=1 Tax=Cylas formicarius TaxID=197179 RepID=UPI00295842D8|nr:uncharacterized protein LOC132703472 [Cylas formicarius]